MGRGSSCIDVVFDIYQEKSIKTVERAERGSKLGIVFSQKKTRASNQELEADLG